MANTWYTLEPLDDRSWIGQCARTQSQFSATFTATLGLLKRELLHLAGPTLGLPVLMIDVPRSDLRLDGQLRAKARPESPAVALSVTTPHGPLRFQCDRFLTRAQQGPAWQHNLRAIALTLESLRSVNRYGAVATGQQYAGFRALEAPRPMSEQEARQVIWSAAGNDDGPAGSVDWLATLRQARRRNHPDVTGGDRAVWDAVEQASKALFG